MAFHLFGAVPARIFANYSAAISEELNKRVTLDTISRYVYADDHLSLFGQEDAGNELCTGLTVFLKGIAFLLTKWTSDNHGFPDINLGNE